MNMQGTQRCIGRQEKTVWTRTYNVCVHIHMSHVAEGEQHEQFTLPLISFSTPYRGGFPPSCVHDL